MPGWLEEDLHYANYAFTALFAIELFIRVMGQVRILLPGSPADTSLLGHLPAHG